MTELPVFPQEFIKKHCPKVLEARDWRKIYKVKDRTDEDDMEFAECAFHSAGCGLQCENCDKFICEVGSIKPADKFVPAIRQFYLDCAAYEKERAKEEANKLEAGSGI